MEKGIEQVKTKFDKNKTLEKRGKLVVQEDFCGDWYLS